MARFIPSNSNAIKSKISPAVVYLFGKSCALGYYGKAENASFNYRFKSADARAKYVGEWFKSMDARAADKAARKAEKAAKPRVLAVGDVLCASWGYEQTNVDFYQVVELIGDKSVKVRKIASDEKVQDDQHFNDRGQCVPVVDAFIGDVFRKRDDQGSISLTSYSSARKMEPAAVLPNGSKVYESQYWSSYA